MIASNLKGVDFIAINTDAQALYHCDAPNKINVGKATQREDLAPARIRTLDGNPRKKVPKKSNQCLKEPTWYLLHADLEEERERAERPIVAEIAKELGILTVAVVTKPFSFEGMKRKQQAEDVLLKT